MKKILIIIILIIIILILLIFLNRKKDTSINKLLNKKVEYDKLLKIEYSNSGNSNGNIDSISIDIDKLILTKRYREEIGIPIEATEYKITKENIEYLKNYIEKYNLVAWSFLEIDDDNIILDGSVVNICFIYDNSKINGEKYKTYSISYANKIPKDGYKILNEFNNYIFSLEKEENLIKKYIEK